MATSKKKPKDTDCAAKMKKSFQAGMNIGRNMKKPNNKKKK